MVLMWAWHSYFVVVVVAVKCGLRLQDKLKLFVASILFAVAVAVLPVMLY